MPFKFPLIALTVMLMLAITGCTLANQNIYENSLVTNVSIVGFEHKTIAKVTHYYVKFKDGEEIKLFDLNISERSTPVNSDIYNQIQEYIKISKVNGVEPKFNMIVDEKKKEIRAISVQGAPKDGLSKETSTQYHKESATAGFFFFLEDINNRFTP